MAINQKLIGTRIRKIRKSKGETQRQLGDSLGYTEQYISKLERGIGNVSLGKLGEIADYYGVDVAKLITNANQKSPDYMFEEIVELLGQLDEKQREQAIEHINIIKRY